IPVSFSIKPSSHSSGVMPRSHRIHPGQRENLSRNGIRGLLHRQQKRTSLDHQQPKQFFLL
ncbi:MAG TPA: hypothetical protein VLG72_06305, partial [Nitrospirota bacterium]|nr:hypothetical protein [Nitrospirota bacterium]